MSTFEALEAFGDINERFIARADALLDASADAGAPKKQHRLRTFLQSHYGLTVAASVVLTAAVTYAVILFSARGWPKIAAHFGWGQSETETGEPVDTLPEWPDAAEQEKLLNIMQGPYGTSNVYRLTGNIVESRYGYIDADMFPPSLIDPLTGTDVPLCTDPDCDHNEPMIESQCPYSHANYFHWTDDNKLVFIASRWVNTGRNYPEQEDMTIRGGNWYNVRVDVKVLDPATGSLTVLHTFRADGWGEETVGGWSTAGPVGFSIDYVGDTAYIIHREPDGETIAENHIGAVLYTLDLHTGKLERMLTLRNDVWIILWADDRSLYVVYDGGEIGALDRTSGEMRVLFDDITFYTNRQAGIVDGKLYMLCYEGDSNSTFLYRIDLQAETYEKLIPADTINFYLTNQYIIIHDRYGLFEGETGYSPVIQLTYDLGNREVLGRLEYGKESLDLLFGELYLLSSDRFNLAQRCFIPHGTD